MRPLIALLAVLVAAPALAGCLAPPSEEDGDADAPTPSAPPAASPSPEPTPRERETREVSGTISGPTSKTETITIPAGAERLDVEATWVITGPGSIHLTTPTGEVAQTESWSSGSTKQGASWYAVDAPTQGDWTLHLSASGGGQYSLRFTY